MQKLITKTVLFTGLLLAACNSGSDNKMLTAKKEELSSLIKQQKELTDKIAKLEKEIGLLDTASAKEVQQKLVQTTAVTQELFQHYIDLQGKIEAVNISYVTPRAGGGQVKQLLVKKGDVVAKGQLLLKLDDALLRRNLTAAQQGLQTLKSQLALATNVYQKQKNLWEQNIGTEIQLLTAKTNLETLESQLKTSEEQIKVIQEQINFTNVYAEVGGVADEVNVRVGEFFTGMGQIKIVNTTDLKVTTQIPENYLGKVKVGSKVRLRFPDINKTIEAIVTVTSKLIDANSRSFYAEIKIPADNAFHPNQLAIVNILDYANDKALAIPINTVQSDQTGKYVMIASNEKGRLIARKKTVTIGELYENKVEIKAGLTIGEQLITEGFQNLYEGQPITTSLQ